MATSKKFSELPAASSVGNGDLFAIAHEDALAETGYVSQKLTAAQAGQKVNGDTEYPTNLPSFPANGQNPFAALEKLNSDIIGLYPVNTASGSIANFTTSLALPLVACEADIVAQQASGTPSPSNPLPISGVSSVSLTHTGKNLFNPSISSNINTGITIWGLSDINIVAFFNKLPVGNYRFSFKIRVDAINGNSAYKYGIILANSSSGNITMRNDETNVVVGSIFERSENVNVTASNKGLFTNFWFYCGRSIAEGTDKCTFYDFQLEVGNTQTTYEPYNAETKTIALGQTVYGGVLDAINGSVTNKRWYKKVKWSEGTNVVSLGDYTRKIFNFETLGYNVYPQTAAYPQLCNVATYLANFNVDSLHFYANANSIIVFLPNDTDGDTEIEITGELATPIEITVLTPANFTTFAGEQNIFSDCGDISVSFKQGIQEYIDAKIAETQALIL